MTNLFQRDLFTETLSVEERAIYNANNLNNKEIVSLFFAEKDVDKVVEFLNNDIEIKGTNELVAKAKALKTLAKRNKSNVYINSSNDVFQHIKHYAFNAVQEQFIIVMLDGAHKVFDINVLSLGSVNTTFCHPREVFAPAIEKRCTNIIVAHNHPSGNLLASEEDIEVTKRLITCGRILGIKVLDHIIFSFEDYRSMSDNHDAIF